MCNVRTEPSVCKAHTCFSCPGAESQLETVSFLSENIKKEDLRHSACKIKNPLLDHGYVHANQ